jgi:hypothetical protein
MKKYLIAIFVIISGLNLKAQVIQSIDAVKGSISDAEKLTRAYVTPLERGFGSLGSNGWINFNNSGKNKTFTFDIGVEFMLGITPEVDRTYDINELELTELKASNPNETIAQTVSGDVESIWLETKDTYKTPTSSFPFTKDSPVYKFQTAEGSGYPLTALPLLTGGVSAYGAHISARWLPKITLSDVKANFTSYGGGIQINTFEFLHTFFNFIEKPLGIEISFLSAYQITELNYNPMIVPDTAQIGISLEDNGPYDNQNFMIKTYSMPMQVVASKKWKVFTFYGGFGYNLTSSEVALTGNFPVYASDPSNTMQVIVEDIENPFAYTQEHNEFRFDLGLVFQYGIIKMRTNYTFAKYDVVNLSVDLSF